MAEAATVVHHEDEAEDVDESPRNNNFKASSLSSLHSVEQDEHEYPLEELQAYAKSHRMRRVRWSEDLEEIRYFNTKIKKDKRRNSEDCSIGTDQMRRRFIELSNAPMDKLRKWFDEKDLKSDVIVLGLKMKSAFNKKADFYDAENKWDKDEMEKGAVNGIVYKR